MSLRCLQPHTYQQQQHSQARKIQEIKRGWPQIKLEIANVEYLVRIPIFSLQLNTKCNTRDDMINKKMSNPMLGEIAR